MGNNAAIVTDRDVYTARLRAMDKTHGFPCLAYALMSMVPIISDKVPTAGTDKWWRLYVNPQFFATLDPDQGAMVLVHEVWHLLSEHWKRATLYGVRPDEQFMWNVAGDCEINTKDQLWKRLTADCVRPEKFGFPDNLTAEEYFKLLKEKYPTVTISIAGKPIPGDVGGGKCGSCAHGHSHDYELPGLDEGGTGDAAKGVDITRGKLIIDETARQIIEEASRDRGSIPSGWERWAKKILKPEVDWRIYLRSTLNGMLTTSTGHTVPTYRKMARRQYKYPNFIIPAYQDPIPHVAVIIDTSGSMSDEFVGQGIAEVDGILRAVGRGILVDVFFTDAATYATQRVSCASSLIPYGGGGTDMTEGFRAVEKASKEDPSSRPSLIVVVTDGYTPWPEKAPDYAQVCIVLVGSNTESAPWAKPPRHNTVKIAVKTAEQV